jgi:DMATS type aromatic prenyltransferase
MAAVAIQSPVFRAIGEEKSAAGVTNGAAAGQEYWWNTTGRDLANMLFEAKYPEEVQRNFLSYYRDTICTQLGPRPTKDSAKSGVGWDGTPLEYSWELKGSTKKSAVRFVVDLSPLNPADNDNPLSMESTQRVIDEMSKKTPGFDDTWVASLKKWFVYSHLSTAEQKKLVEHSGQQTSVILGFDIYPTITAPGGLPVMAKIYYPPCYAAAAKNITRWQAVYQGIQQLPQIEEFPNITKSAAVIDDFLSDKPKEWQNGVRYLATDLVKPGKARMKMYMRCWGDSFDEIWDYYTLGGRIPNLDEDKEKFRDLMNLLSGNAYEKKVGKQDKAMDKDRFTSATQKLTAIYFALSADNPTPAPKLCLYPKNFAPTDEVIAKGLDTWLQKYEWHDGGKNMEDRIKSVLYVCNFPPS